MQTPKSDRPLEIWSRDAHWMASKTGWRTGKDAMTGVKQVDSVLVEMARSFGAKEKEIFFKIILPAAMPAIMAGVRLGMGRAVKGMVTAEMLLTLTGIGAMIMQYGSSFATDSLFAVILTILIIAMITMQAVQWLDRRLTGWKAEIAIE